MQVIQLQSIKNYIKHSHHQTLSGIFATFSLCLFTLLTVFPIVGVEQKTEAATGTASTTSLTLTTTGGASLDLAVDSNNGTFATTDPASSNYSSTSTQAEFTVTTTNYTGYTLSISNSDSDTNLTASDTTGSSVSTIASIPTGSSLTASQFNNATYNGKWGYKPSKYYDTSTSTVVDNSSTSTGVYLPSPTTTATTLNITNCANGKSNGSNTCPDAVDTYTIDLAARLEYTQDSGSYTNTFILTAVGNPIDYTVNYNGTGADSGTTPGVAEDETNLTYITLSSITPTKDGYTFKGWCTVDTGTDGTNACTGTTYQPGDQYPINQTTQNVATLYAMWEQNCNGGGLYCTIASMSKGTQTADDLKATITIPTSADRTQDTSNSGVYEYDASVFGTSSDASNDYAIYYYRGVLENSVGSYGSDGSAVTYPNYVKLSNNTCWRIVRTTGSGGVKMIYNGTYGATTAGSCANAMTNTSDYSGTYDNANIRTNSAFNSDPSNSKGIVGVGYTFNSNYKTTTTDTTYSTLFGTNSASAANTTNSTIKTAVDNWYSSNLSSYASKLETSAGYCNDRTLGTSMSWTSPVADNTSIQRPYGTQDSGFTEYYFGAYARTYNSRQKPTLTCTRGNADLYTTSAASNGNKRLTYPVALLTADEANFAGSCPSGSRYSGTSHANAFLRSGSNFWLLSPSYRNSLGSVGGLYVGSGGYVVGSGVSLAYGVRPAVSLNPGMVITSGNGTATDPWEVDYPTMDVTMQDFTASMCQTNASNGPVYVRDVRDGQEYTVRYINGACWMTSNLRFTETTLSSSTSNVASTYTDASPYTINQNKSASAWKSLASDSVCKGVSNTVDNTSYQCMQEGVDDNNNATVWYNYAGATAGTITGTSNSTAATYDICPKNWHLPTSTEINGFDGTNNGNATYAASTQFAPVYGGDYYSGSLSSASTRGNWWSATAYGTTSRYGLRYYSSKLYSGSNYYYDRLSGLYVRCVRSS